MKLKSCKVENFGSYASLSFSFDNLGLGLIQGSTGSGKSTMMDMACWILYGVTAKNGSVDDVRSWINPSEPTRGVIDVETQSGLVTVERIRGRSSDNDLFWTESMAPDTSIRGKDIQDTQKRLEERLGISAELFQIAAYFHEFSPTASFFTAKAKDRRELFERIASLDLPMRVAYAASERRKEDKASLQGHKLQYNNVLGRVEELTSGRANARREVGKYDADRARKLDLLDTQAKDFEKIKKQKVREAKAQVEAFEKELEEKISELEKQAQDIPNLEEKIALYEETVGNLESESKCSKCNNLRPEISAKITGLLVDRSKTEQALKNAVLARKEVKKLYEKVNPASALLEAAECMENTYARDMKHLKAQENPFADLTRKLEAQLAEAKTALQSEKNQVDQLETSISDLSRLYDLSLILRGELLNKAVKEIQDKTNHYLESHFDAELRVEFQTSGDNLNVSIQKSGYPCVFKQLSKGQRQLLNLCFGISVMTVSANNSGVHFDNLFFDEALDGLDSDLKIKAFSLFEDLQKEHGTVLLIDHAPEFHNMFSTRFRVTNVGDVSEVGSE